MAGAPAARSSRWINQRLARRGGPVVEDLYVDLRDGFALVALLDELGGEGGAAAPRGASPAKRRLSSGGLRIQHIANVSVAFKQLEARAVRTTGIGPPDIVDGNVTLVLGLVYSIIAWSTTRAIDSAAPARGSDDSDEARGGGGEGAGGGGARGEGGEGEGGRRATPRARRRRRRRTAAAAAARRGRAAFELRRRVRQGAAARGAACA